MNEINNNNNFSQNILMEIFFYQIFIITNPCITNTVISSKMLNSYRRAVSLNKILPRIIYLELLYSVHQETGKFKDDQA